MFFCRFGAALQRYASSLFFCVLRRERGLRMRLRVRVSIARALFLPRKASKRRCMKLKFLPAAAFNNYYLQNRIAMISHTKSPSHKEFVTIFFLSGFACGQRRQ
jgi:hypothetical protein